MYKNILLIVPPNKTLTRGLLPSLGILYIAAFLKKNNFNVTVLDCPSEQYTYKNAIEYINNSDYDIIGITSVTAVRFEALKIIAGIRINAKIIVGGSHFTFNDIDTLKQYKKILCVVRFEGEMTFLKICQGKDLSEIQGITYRENDKVIRNSDAEYIDINELPWPARELVQMEKYEAYLVGHIKPSYLICTGIITSRGCPNNCIFCSSRAFWKQTLRLRNPIDVVDEIEYIVNKYNITGFEILDDTFTCSKKHVTAICREIIARKLQIKFYARIRVNTVNKDLLVLMKKAGCVSVSFGIESASPRILKEIRKDIDIKQVIKVVRISKEIGLFTKGFFMINLPIEKYIEFFRTLKYANYLNTKYNLYRSMAITFVLPGTEIERDMKRRNKIDSDFSWNKYYNPRHLNKFHTYLNKKIIFRFHPEDLYYSNLRILIIRIFGHVYFNIILRIKRKLLGKKST